MRKGASFTFNNKKKGFKNESLLKKPFTRGVECSLVINFYGKVLRQEQFNLLHKMVPDLNSQNCLRILPEKT
jgi:hypothetical protein